MAFIILVKASALVFVERASSLGTTSPKSTLIVGEIGVQEHLELVKSEASRWMGPWQTVASDM